MPIDTDQASAGTDPLEKRSADDADMARPDDLEQPDDGPALSGGGAMPGGSNMSHWKTAAPGADATDPNSMPGTKATPMPG